MKTATITLSMNEIDIIMRALTVLCDDDDYDEEIKADAEVLGRRFTRETEYGDG